MQLMNLVPVLLEIKPSDVLPVLEYEIQFKKVPPEGDANPTVVFAQASHHATTTVTVPPMIIAPEPPVFVVAPQRIAADLLT